MRIAGVNMVSGIGRMQVVVAGALLVVLLLLSCSDPAGPKSDDNVPPSAITDLTVEIVTSSSATLMWSATGDDSTSGRASGYDIRYSTSPINDTNWQYAVQCSGEPEPLDAGEQQSFIVNGLTENTRYHFAMKTSDEASNWSGISNSDSMTTRFSSYNTWTTTYGGSDHEYSWCVTSTPDGGAIVAGGNLSDGAGLVVWVDANGNTTGKMYGRYWGANIYSIAGSPDGGCVTAGYIVDSNYSDYLNAWFLRLDESGDVIWETRYQGIGSADAMCVTRGNNGNFIAGGTTAYWVFGGEYEQHTFVIELDATTGEIVREVMDIDTSFPRAMDTYGGGVVIASVRDGSAILIMLDDTLGVTDVNVHPIGGFIHMSDVRTCSDGFVAFGTAGIEGVTDHNQMILIRYDDSGEVIWQKLYGETIYYDRAVLGRGVAVMEDGYMLVGHTIGNGDCSVEADLIAIKTERAGGIVREHVYKWSSTSVDDLGMDVAVASDGGCIIAGRTFPGCFSPGDVYILKTDPDGSL
jgi:hypothetical protein